MSKLSQETLDWYAKNKLESDLIDLIEDEYKEFYDSSDIDEDGFDIEYFGKIAKEVIEKELDKTASIVFLIGITLAIINFIFFLKK